MPPTVAARCQVNASVVLPRGASAPTSENWQESIGATPSPETALSTIATGSEPAASSGAITSPAPASTTP